MAAVGSVSVTTDTRLAAAQIREAIGFDLDERRRIPTWTDALRRFIELAAARRQFRGLAESPCAFD